MALELTVNKPFYLPRVDRMDRDDFGSPYMLFSLFGECNGEELGGRVGDITLINEVGPSSSWAEAENYRVSVKHKRPGLTVAVLSDRDYPLNDQLLETMYFLREISWRGIRSQMVEGKNPSIPNLKDYFVIGGAITNAKGLEATIGGRRRVPLYLLIRAPFGDMFYNAGSTDDWKEQEDVDRERAFWNAQGGGDSDLDHATRLDYLLSDWKSADDSSATRKVTHTETVLVHRDDIPNMQFVFSEVPFSDTIREQR